eukprot:CAMPEP_0183538360 /NCGR_PEP_ID=MMETSP0371-20130417/29532_1 /TAXON_ID=268820 /ORGANISM="Peridinium aciculiferum, Strain PAER-2" /LENGTH=92 /DNA_ID=CAMNT_0025739189 /DNA_START=382 /DNA_END=660 /DNA_ORIENTATION=-
MACAGRRLVAAPASCRTTAREGVHGASAAQDDVDFVQLRRGSRRRAQARGKGAAAHGAVDKLVDVQLDVGHGFFVRMRALPGNRWRGILHNR